MDEWSVLARLQDYDALKKQEQEEQTKRFKQNDLLNQLNKQRQEQQIREYHRNFESKQIEKQMIEMDRKLFEEERQKLRDKEEQRRQLIQDTLTQD